MFVLADDEEKIKMTAKNEIHWSKSCFVRIGVDIGYLSRVSQEPIHSWLV